MKTAIMIEINKIEIKDTPKPAPKQGELLIKLCSVGICGSDIHYYKDGRIGDFVVNAPIILGHEASGIVEEVGEGITSFKVGDRVALEPGIPCNNCEHCFKGNYNLCEDVVFFATPPIDGVFCEYVAHPANFCFKLPDSVSFDEGAMVEPLAIGFHAAEIANATVGQKAIVFGAGAIGLVSLLALKAYGVSEIYVVDSVENRLNKALELGATGIINFTKTDILANFSEIDLILETSGSEIAANQAIRIAKKGAKIVMIGYPHSGKMNLDMSVAINKELEFKTIFRYRHMFPKVISAISKGIINIKPLISHRYNFDNIVEAMEQVANDKESITKAVIQIYNNEGDV